MLFTTKNKLFVTTVHNKNKPSITSHHTPRYTSRVLSECDTESSIYDNDEDMKSVKENFDRQTSQRFEEYEERMNEKRQKCKEQCDKDIEQIILRDKTKKSLEEKVENICLRCGCGLGGIAAGVGIFGSLGTYGWEIGATAAAIELATKEGIKAGIQTVIVKINEVNAFVELKNVPWTNIIYESNYNTVNGLFNAIMDAMASIGKSCKSHTFENACNGILARTNYWLDSVAEAGIKVTASTTESAKTTKLGEVATASYDAYTAIAYSVTAILIIVLIMVIIYLFLRYRRKKKMNKKLQYTKLLNQ
ncbi:surface antigen [Plasmodium falciparum UGT5.1]|uniref:Surface antigen n=1 Tax=Plasmodium falciparum UGT5.1 TaxID=1237627 RepID=W7JJE7_PLAFA|nr:surface antigen [Plasmodium falciparum UGT5.1]